MAAAVSVNGELAARLTLRDVPRSMQSDQPVPQAGRETRDYAWVTGRVHCCGS